MGVSALAVNGDLKSISDERITELEAALRGQLLLPESDGYDEARTIWNAMIDRRPALIARCAGPADVIRAVRFAADNELLPAVRGAGHNIAGKGVFDDAFLIDLSALRSVHVDAERRVARVDPGATLGDLDDETQVFGLATSVGINSDLFWGIRGGGGNFGVVTSFEFDLHPVGPEVLSGLVVHPYSAAPEVFRFYRDFAADLPEDLNVWIVLRKAPPLPFLPEEVHGTEIVILAAFYAGDMVDGERAVKPVRDFGDPIADVIGPHPFTGWQTAFDPLLTPGARNYWKSHNFIDLPDDLIDTALDYTGRLPSDQTEIFFGRLGGAVNEVAPDATAYPHRDAEYVMNVHARWETPAEDEKCVAWAREYFDASAPYATGGVYVNFVPDGESPLAAAYGDNYQRLVELKRKYDPTNLFRLNQNIAP
jgi:FAD/FMN-containing dehydrogenase